MLRHGSSASLYGLRWRVDDLYRLAPNRVIIVGDGSLQRSELLDQPDKGPRTKRQRLCMLAGLLAIGGGSQKAPAAFLHRLLGEVSCLPHEFSAKPLASFTLYHAMQARLSRSKSWWSCLPNTGKPATVPQRQ
jgi:hypothetical protein